ncbi:peptidase MA family metallohydrolase, partial [Candidatus Zixiibacteriota bacterium]
MKRSAVIFIFLVICLLGWTVETSAQFYFGKNKIQYTDFQWQVMKSDHFELYFYPQERELAQAAVAMAEESYAELSAKFHQPISKPIPLILYSTHNYFQQTNTIPYMLPEGVGGFLEFMKGRVVIPFNGSYARLRHTIRHELVHVFTLSKIRSVLHDHEKFHYYTPPLWLIEGLAEYWSSDWDAQAEMILRDAVITGNLVSLQQMYRINGTFQMYKEGQSAAEFISQHYGQDKIRRLFENWWKSKKFSEILQYTLGTNLEEMDKEWQYSLKKRYFPLLKDLDLPTQVAEPLTSQGSNVKPAICPSGEDGLESVVFMSNRMGYEAVYLLKMATEGGLEKQLIRGERTPEFESLHLLRSKLDVSNQRVLAIVSKSQETDVLNLWDVEGAKVTRKFHFPGLISLASPSWSPAGDQIAFTGADRHGHVDLYTVAIPGGELRRLSEDLYEDRDPSWSPDGRHLAFSSDRSAGGAHGFRHLFLYHLSDGTIEQLTDGDHNDYAPSWSPDGTRIAFCSDREGVFNLYVQETDGQERRVHRLTNILTGAFDPAWSGDGQQLIFSAFEKGRFQIYRMDLPDPLDPGVLVTRPETVEGWRPEKLAARRTPALGKYRKKLSLDIAQSAISYDPVFGVGGGFQV